MSRRFEVKCEGSTRVYALTDTLADAELLARNLTRSTGEVFYAKERGK